MNPGPVGSVLLQATNLDPIHEPDPEMDPGSKMENKINLQINRNHYINYKLIKTKKKSYLNEY